MPRSRRHGTSVLAIALLTLATGMAWGGEIALAWDAAPGATGYEVYYGTASGQYLATPKSSTSNTYKLTGLQDCTTWYIAVKAVNSAGKSAFSNEVSGWPRPAVTRVTPSSLKQGEQMVLDIYGTNFQSGAHVDLLLQSIQQALSNSQPLPVDDPRLVATSVATMACDHVQILAKLEPSAPHAQAAPVGPIWVAVNNPDYVFGENGTAFQVAVEPHRADINQSDDFTRDRVDGQDTVWLASLWGRKVGEALYDGDYDIDGDGEVNGNDLAILATYYGKCWTGTTWSLQACPATLR